MTLRLAEVVLIRMQFHQERGSKIRPAVVLVDSGDDDFVAAPVTSQARASEYDLALTDWRGAGLNVASTIRLHKLTALPKADIARRLGTLAGGDHEALTRLLCKLFCPK